MSRHDDIDGLWITSLLDAQEYRENVCDTCKGQCEVPVYRLGPGGRRVIDGYRTCGDCDGIGVA